MQGAPAPHQKVPVFPGCHVGYSLRLERGQHPLWLTRVRAVRYPENSRSQPPLLLGPVFPGCHRKRVITPP